ncbi:MAG: AzlD domain-containing protein [Actinobacteria bacterium]|nr:MAG: AzlD domain-containing protein [Actinomycetota bacterium]
MTMWLVVIAAGIATFTIRFVFIALFGKIEVPPALERGLRYIAPAVLAALTVPTLVAPGGQFDPWNVFVPAAIIGGIAAWATKSIGAAIVIGLPAVWLLQWLV